MSVYVDPLMVFGGDSAPRCFRHKASCHMYADSLEELHRLAGAIGLRREWFQDHAALPHYDLTASRRELAVRAGAIEHSTREMGRWRAEHFGRLGGG
jgi:hypothetical protein